MQITWSKPAPRIRNAIDNATPDIAIDSPMYALGDRVEKYSREKKEVIHEAAEFFGC